MFHCEKCGSRYSAMHAATIENCPRCLARDQTRSPLTFKAFRLPSHSSTTSAADLSSRSPLNEPWRTNPSPVSSRNSISATRLGST
jgi:hypothetical protein